MGQNIAEEMPEPPDGTMLVLIETLGYRRIIWRNDSDSHSRYEDERWFDHHDSDPMNWVNVMMYAEKVYAVSTQPIYTR